MQEEMGIKEIIKELAGLIKPCFLYISVFHGRIVEIKYAISI